MYFEYFHHKQSLQIID